MLTRRVVRKKILISGIVQGVGFRPAVYRRALENNISGHVINTSSGVVIEAEGLPANIKKFVEGISDGAPARSKIDSISVNGIEPSGNEGFFIGESLVEKARPHLTSCGLAIVPADLSICGECRADILNKSNRRYLYPFTNCTNCGPRFTITRRLPYDRPFTTMKSFKMCPACLKEYENPLDRRFHAQPNACPDCGPGVEPSLTVAASAIRKGGIVAIQSLGGFHIACDASNHKAVLKLRKRKGRPHKPFAIMVPDIPAARRLCRINEAEAKVLTSPRAPIVMLEKKTNAIEWVAPGLPGLGVMLSYTPLHVVLFKILKDNGFSSPLVMTSGNRRDEPICRTKKEAVESLSGIADLIISHDRIIHNRCDDSVVFVRKGLVHPVRRSRGFVPDCVSLADKGGGSVLGCGAHLKNTFCLTRGKEAFLSQHIGDLDEESARKFYREALSRMKSFLDVEPAVIAHDLHPDYPSTRIAMGMKGGKIGVQHHFAHIASVMAEHGISEPVLGAALDGTGYGTDGTIWGCEFMEVRAQVGGAQWKRLGHLEAFPLPGGDAAVFEIWRSALSCLKFFCPGTVNMGKGDSPIFLRKIGTVPMFSGINPKKLKVVEKMIDLRVNSPMTSSMGRLFDAVAFLAGVGNEASYEAQGPMELENLCSRRPQNAYRFGIYEKNGILLADPSPVLNSIIAESGKKRAADISEKFHAAVSDMVCEMISRLSRKTGIKNVALSGGVFQNRIILDWTVEGLSRLGFKVFVNEQVPANDGGISLGQVWAALLVCAPKGNRTPLFALKGQCPSR